ncbi:MAG: DEAD/DEAH box helicase [Candidatus Lokiarchaeota archaeon]|nr:DEAD/DEAH box helicase [Candidatus Lokiarchaeota archaeon]
MAQAKTGSGKTLAFVLPIIERLKYVNNEALILAPTRELAKQINSVIKELGDPRVKSMTIYGGVSISNQIRKLHEGVNIIIGTPGRIIDLYKRRELKFHNIRFVVLDEGDRLWDMGFAPDVQYILNQIKTDYQFLLFSATLYSDIREMVKKFSKNKFEFLNLSRDSITVGSTKQFYYMIERFEEKFKTFLKILRREKPEHTLVFVNTKKTATWLNNKLRSARGINFRVQVISGDLSQAQREKVLLDFRNHKINMLIATDVAARGLDIDNISHVFNYDVPKFPDVYVHRIGRTSRMSKKGVAITLCLKDEYEYLCHIEGLIDKEIKQKELYQPQQEEGRYHNPFY